MTPGARRDEIGDIHLAWVRKPDLPQGFAWLTASETAALGGLRLDKRRTDWLLGRWAAKLAVRSAVGHELPLLEILADADGRPRVHAGEGADPTLAASLSISHSAGTGFGAAVVGNRRIGCDVEAIEPRSEAFVADYFTTAERDAVAAIAEAERALVANLVWSAKESALKALGEGLRLDTRSVQVSVPDLKGDHSVSEWSPLFVAARDGRTFEGRWRAAEGLVWTVLSEAG
jgi:4'-phosphopantetheinyl transferase